MSLCFFSLQDNVLVGLFHQAFGLFILQICAALSYSLQAACKLPWWLSSASLLDLQSVVLTSLLCTLFCHHCIHGALTTLFTRFLTTGLSKLVVQVCHFFFLYWEIFYFFSVCIEFYSCCLYGLFTIKEKRNSGNRLMLIEIER